MNLKRLYLALTVAGLALPWFFLVSFILENGPALRMAQGQLWADNMVRFFVVDVLVTGLTLLSYLVLRGGRRKGRLWLLTGAVLLVGPSCALPLWFYFREKDRESPKVAAVQPKR